MYIENKILKNYISIWLQCMFWIVSIMIVVGGLTRLTDSGLSITQWELFSGILPPLSQNDWQYYFQLYKEIPEYKIQNFSMSLKEFKIIYWWEYAHRILGRFIGLLFIIPLIFFTMKLGFKKLKFFYFIFSLICFQGFIGWYMVSSGLIDRVDVSHYRLALHLVIAFIILSLIYWSYLSIKISDVTFKSINSIIPLFFTILIFFQICIGAFVSGMDAGQIYNSWPLMGSTYFPDDNLLANLFKFSVFNDPSLVQFLHRNLAYIILFFYIYTYIKIKKLKILELLNIINIIGILLLLQIVLGIFTLLFNAHIFIASLHQISSIFLVSATIYFLRLNYKSN